MEGFIVFDYTSQFPAAEREMAEWLKQGKIGPVKYHVEKGIEKCASSLGLLFEGKNHGKL
jgi:NADPH-dependent curcumin reductase CurA